MSQSWSYHAKNILHCWYANDTFDVIDGSQAIELELSLTDAQTTLLPGQAVSVLNDRVKLIGKVNSDIADWLSVSETMSLNGAPLTHVLGATTC